MDAVSLLVGGLAGAGLAAFAGRSREDRTAPEGLADVLQWGFLVEGPARAVVLNKDGALLAGWRYHGPDVATASAAELHAIARQVNDALLPYGDGWMWHVDAVRRPAEAYAPSAFPPIAAGAPDVSVPAWIDAERRRDFAAACARTPDVGGGAGQGSTGAVMTSHGVSRAQFVSEFTLTLTYLPPAETHARAARFFVSGAAPLRSAAAVWADALARFERQVAVLEQRLGGRFHLARLDAEALLTHLHGCLTALPHPVQAPPVGAYVNSVLASQEFVPGFVPRIGRQHVHVVAVESYPDAPAGGPGSERARLDVLNTLGLPYRWSSRFVPVGQQTADRIIRRHRQAWFSKRKDFGTFVRDLASNKERNGYEQQREDELFGNQDATAMLRDLNAAQAVNASGAVRFGFSTQVVVVADEDPAVSAARAAEVTRVLHQHGFTARVESVNAPDAFFGSLPGHGYQNLRRPLLHSKNLADIWPLTSVWAGLPANPSQFFPAGSPPLMHVATGGSTPFRLNLHVGDVGHVAVVGATGAGKSTLLGLIEAQWLRYPDAQLVIFDYDYSHHLLASACGAQHYDLCAGRPDAVAFQPLADVDQPAERAWAGSWLEVLLELQGVAVTPAQRTRLARALVLLGAQPRRHRTLSDFVDQLQDADLRTALLPYLAGGTYGTLFDASSDAVGDAALQVFELKHLLTLGEKVVTPAFLYLAHRIDRRLDGRPTLTVVEEIHALLGRAGFADLLRTWLLTQRKRNGAVAMVFHTPAQLDALAAKQVVIESCPTRILLPNAEAGTVENARLYRELGLTDAEITLVAEAVPKQDYYVRSPLGSRVVQLDLGPVARAFIGTPAGMGPDVLRETIAALAAEHGPAWPRAWLARLGVAVPDGALVREPGARPAPACAAADDWDAVIPVVIEPSGDPSLAEDLAGPVPATLGRPRPAAPPPGVRTRTSTTAAGAGA